MKKIGTVIGIIFATIFYLYGCWCSGDFVGDMLVAWAEKAADE